MGLFMRVGWGDWRGERPLEVAGGIHAGIGGWAGGCECSYRDAEFGAVPPTFFLGRSIRESSPYPSPATYIGKKCAFFGIYIYGHCWAGTGYRKRSLYPGACVAFRSV